VDSYIFGVAPLNTGQLTERRRGGEGDRHNRRWLYPWEERLNEACRGRLGDFRPNILFLITAAKDVAIIGSPFTPDAHHQIDPSIHRKDHGHRIHPCLREFCPCHTLQPILTRRSQNKVLYAPLAEIDPEVKNIIDKETWRQFTGLELIASEVRLFTPLLLRSPLDILSSHRT